jgi:hypothetical protein
MNIQDQANALFEDQKTGWPLLGANWDQLDAARLRQFDFDGFSIRVQFNPRRIISSAARVDRASIENRPCFLCEENRPPEEDRVVFGDRYEILCNPFPIFRQHYTIAHREHIPQVIDPEFREYLALSRNLPELVVFYNAPDCGASAPDHLHFQAGSLGFMPIEAEISALEEAYGTPVHGAAGSRIYAVDDGLRRFLVLESGDARYLEGAFRPISAFLRERSGDREPMLNMLAYYREGWQILLFPRERHRPWQYFEEGEKNILLSPAAVDMGGTLITPMEKDFLKIGKEDIEDIFGQICLSAGDFAALTRSLIKSL